MAFYIHQTDDGHVPGFEFMPCSAITPKVGMAMKVTSGNLAVAGATDKPLYISMTERTQACAAGDLIPVIRVNPDIIFEVATPSSFSQAVGVKAKLGSDGISLQNASGGTAEIVYTDAEITRVRFVEPDAAG